MVCTDDTDLFETVRMLRSHGMVRESTSPARRAEFQGAYPDLNPDFIFAFPAYNVRSTEINAVIGRNQLGRLDAGNRIRSRNLAVFLDSLDASKYRTDFRREGSSNYAFTLVLREPDESLRDRVEATLRARRIEFRRGTSGGGNQLRQPYLRRLLGDVFGDFPEVEHVHFFGYYIGNYPDLDDSRVRALCDVLNSL